MTGQGRTGEETARVRRPRADPRTRHPDPTVTLVRIPHAGTPL
ncbi:hypothetical protein ACTU45_01935 [Streptomyces sp. 24-1644]